MITEDRYLGKKYLCHTCHWEGLGKDCLERNLFEDLIELDCPNCGEKIDILTLEKDSNPFLLNTNNRVAQHSFSELLLNEDAVQHAIPLKDTNQLANLNEDYFVFTWDLQEIDTNTFCIVKFGSQLIWEEEMDPLRVSQRYMEMGNIFKSKYGERILDIVPTPRAERFLFQDTLDSLRVGKYRESFRRP